VIAHLTPLKREVRSRDGRWYDVRLRPYRTVDDKIDGVVITFVDVTERLQVERALRDSEESLRQGKRLMELSHDPIFIWDFDNGIIEWNRGSVELYGFTREEALGKHKPSFLETRVPGSSFEELRRTLLETGLWNGELQQRTKDGRDLIVESRIVLETMNGRRLALESTHDITERRLWEQRQQILLRELTIESTTRWRWFRPLRARPCATLRQALILSPGLMAVSQALSRAHYLLVASDWRGANLAELARSQLEAHASDASGRVYIDGESVSLPVDLATPFSLVLHELATNASKYGSLSRPEGSVHLGWTVATENNRRVLRLVWQEQDGPSVNSPVKTGLGTTLINTAIPGATVSREFRREGFRFTIEAPLSEQSSAE
jgi:two-component system, chemotaxis family, CheB/CheR fusion protein